MSDIKITNVDKKKCADFLSRIDQVGLWQALAESDPAVSQAVDEIMELGFYIRFDSVRGWEVLQFDPDGQFWYPFDPVRDRHKFGAKPGELFENPEEFKPHGEPSGDSG